MQFIIELPDELGQKLLQQADVQKIVQEAIEKVLSEKPRLLTDIAKDLPEITCFKGKDPLEMQKALRDEWY